MAFNPARFQSWCTDSFSSYLFRILSVFVISVIFSIVIFLYAKTLQTAKTPRMLHVGEIPICKENLLNARHYDFDKWASESNPDNLLSGTAYSGSSTCRLLNYSQDLAVKCFDDYARKKQAIDNRTSALKNSSNSRQHFVFVGDSRTRQLFYNFLTFVPKYDWKTSRMPRYFHGDMEVLSDILRVKVSFKWRTILHWTLLETVQKIRSTKPTPDWILFGGQVHNMLDMHNISFANYKSRLEGIAPYLDKLGAVAKVIWINQYPSYDVFSIGGDHALNGQINSEKIDRYNKATREILERYTNVHFWDSSHKLAKDYVRSCQFFERYTEPVDRDYWYTHNCHDFLHTGNVALREATQILLNDYCNHIFDEIPM